MSDPHPVPRESATGGSGWCHALPRFEAWPETLQDARRRFALRFLQYLQRGQVARPRGAAGGCRELLQDG